MSKSKRQGTAWETAVVTRMKAAGLSAGRHPEGGSKDNGDVWIDSYEDGVATTIDAECKVVQSGRPHAWLAEQQRKARPNAIPVVIWKRLLATKPDAKRRTSQGEVVIIDLDDFISLIGGTP